MLKRFIKNKLVRRIFKIVVFLALGIWLDIMFWEGVQAGALNDWGGWISGISIFIVATGFWLRATLLIFGKEKPQSEVKESKPSDTLNKWLGDVNARNTKS